MAVRLRYVFFGSRARDVVLRFVIVNARIFVLYYYEAFSLVFCSLSTIQVRTFIFIDSSFPSAESDGRFGVAQSVDEHGERV